MEKRDKYGNPYEGQLELPFEENEQSRRAFRFAMAVVTAFIAVLFATLVWAQESKSVIMTQGLLCDTEDEVKNQVDIMSSSDVSGTPLFTLEGCGELLRPMPAEITPIGVYENKHVTVLLVTIQMPRMPVQYGYAGWRAKPKGHDI